MAAVRLTGRTAPRRSTAPASLMDAGEVARVAYELYQQRGYQNGHDLDDWLKAEAIVHQRHAEGKGGDGRF